MDTAELVELGQQLRVDSVRAADAAGSGHPTSSMSAAEDTGCLLTGSASPAEQLRAAGIDAESIAAAGRLLVETAVVR